MIIGIDASRANRKYKSGTEWYSFYLIKELARIDQDNQYILYTDVALEKSLANLTPANISLDSDIDKKGFQKVASPHNNFKAKVLKWPLPFFWTQLRLSWEMILHSPDALFIPAHTLPFIYPKNSVMTIHDLGFERDRQLYSNELMGKSALMRRILNFIVKIFSLGKYGANPLDYLSYSTRFALKHAKKIITISNFSKKEICDIYPVNGENIQVIYHGVNRALYRKIDDQEKIDKVLNKYGINAPYIFYVGRLEKKKNTPNLVDAFSIMREKHKGIKHKLVLVGAASLGFDEVKYIIQQFHLDDEVIITGWVPEEDMPYIFNGATAFIFPSFYEGFGMPLLQAMACGTPVIASNMTSIPEIANNAALLFDPNDKVEMASVMFRIITDRELRDGLIVKGYENVAKFNWEKCARETLKALAGGRKD